MWDAHRSRRDSAVSGMTDSSPAMATPPLTAHHNQHSPLLFAPLSPHYPPGQQSAGRYAATGYFPPVASRASGSRPVTPVSPLNMQELSMEDRPAPSGLAVPALSHRMPHPYQRPIYDAHPGPSSHLHERPRSPGQPFRGHAPADMAASRWSDGYSPLDPPSGGEAYFQGEPNHRGQSRQQHHPHQQPPPPHGMPPYSYSPSERAEYERHMQMQAQHHQSEFTRGARAPPVSPLAQPPVDRIAHSRRRRRPPYSYSSLIAQAISSASEGRMTLREIYTWISNNYPGMYPMTGPESQGWQNTVRHNLSLNKSFIKVARTAQDIYDSCSSGIASQSQAARGKGGWWMLDPSVAAAQIGTGFRSQQEDGPSEGERAATASNDQAKSSGSAAAGSGIGTKRLMRQRSYSDSVNRVGPIRGASGMPSSTTAPSSRDGTVPEDARRTSMDRYASHNRADSGPAGRRGSVYVISTPFVRSDAAAVASGPYSNSRDLGAVEKMPSVLQQRPWMGLAALDDHRAVRPLPPGRARGFTTSAAEPSPLRLYSTSAEQKGRPSLYNYSSPYSSRHHFGSGTDAADGEDHGRRSSAPFANTLPAVGPTHQRHFEAPYHVPRRTSGGSPSLRLAANNATKNLAGSPRLPRSDDDVKMPSPDADEWARKSPRAGDALAPPAKRRSIPEEDEEDDGSRRMSISGLLNG